MKGIGAQRSPVGSLELFDPSTALFSCQDKDSKMVGKKKIGKLAREGRLGIMPKSSK